MSVKIDDKKFDFKKNFQKAVGEPTADQNTPKPEDTKVDFKKTFQESLKKKVTTPAAPEQPDTSSKDVTPSQKVSLEPDNTTEVFDIQKRISEAGKKITTSTGAQININTSKIPAPLNTPSFVEDVQKRVSAGEHSPQDIEAIAAASGKKPEAVSAYLSGDNTTGESIDRKDYIDKSRSGLAATVDTYNKVAGKDLKADDVLSTPDKASNFLANAQDFFKTKIKENTTGDVEQGGRVFTPPNAEREKYEKLYSEFKTISEPLLIKHIEQTTAEEGLIKGEARSVTAKKIAQRLTPREFNNTQKAINQGTGIDRLSDKSSPGQILGGLIEELQGSSTKNADEEILNSQIGWSDIKLNEVYKDLAKDKFALAHLNGDPKMLQQAKDIYSKIDDDIGLQYPATQKSIMADHVARIIADKGGNLVKEGGAMSQTEAESKDNAYRHFGANQVKQIVTDLGWLDDPKMKDNAEWLIDHPGDIKDASTFGGLRNAVTDPFKNLGLGILDVLGVRSKRDVIVDKTKDELFPTEFTDEELKASFNVPVINQPVKARHTVNAIGGLAGMTAIAMATGAIGRAVELGLTAAESAELAAGANTVRNAELLAKTAAASERAAAYTSFALPSVDPNLKGSYDFIDNDAARSLYVTMGAILNGEGGRLLKLGNIARVPGLGEDFARIAQGLTEKTMTKEAANELLKKGENKFVEYAVKFGKNTTAGAATMAYFGFVDKVNRMAFGDPNAKAADLLPEAGKSFVDGIFTMIPFGFVSAAAPKENPNTSMKGFIYDMARSPDATKDVFKLSNLSEQQYNEKVQILNTSVAAKNALDAAQKENGLLLQPTQRAAYVANKTVESVLRSKAEKMEDGKAKNEIINQADELNKQSVATLDGLKFTKTLEPLYDLYEAEKEYDAAYAEFNAKPTPAAENALLKSKEAYQELQNKYFDNKYGNVVDVVPSEHMTEASGIVESAIANGNIPEMMVDQMKASPIKTAQMIADQALGMGRDTEGKRQPISGESADRPQYDKAVEQFGKEAVDKAIKLYPLEEAPAPSVLGSDAVSKKNDIDNTVVTTIPGDGNGNRSELPLSEVLSNESNQYFDLGDNISAIVTDRIVYLIDKNYTNKSGQHIAEKIYKASGKSELSKVNKPNLEIVSKGHNHPIEERLQRLEKARDILKEKLSQPANKPVVNEAKKEYKIGDKVSTVNGEGEVTRITSSGTAIATLKNGSKIMLDEGAFAKPEDNSKKEDTHDANDIKSLVDKYDNIENYTIDDLVNDVEGIADETGNKKLSDAVEEYRKEQEDDRKLSGRGDMDSAQEKIERIIRNEAKSNVPSDFAERHEPVLSQSDADIRWSNGERIFAKSEMDEALHEVKSKDELEKYAPDQLFAYKPEDLTVEGHIKKAQSVLDKVNNAEYINEKEISDAENVLYEALDKNPDAAHLIEPLISKLQDYEFKTKTETRTVTEKEPVEGSLAAKTKREIKPALEQSTGTEVTVTLPDGGVRTGTLDIKSGEYVLDIRGGQQVVLGEKAITDRDLKLPPEERVPEPIAFDADGNVESVTFETKNGNLVTINDPEKALDIAIQLQADAVGEIPDAAFDKVYQEVQKEIKTEVPVKNISSPKTTTDGNEKNSQANAEKGKGEKVSPEEKGRPKNVTEEGKPESIAGSGKPSDGGKGPVKPSTPTATPDDNGEEFTSVRKEKLKEIDGAKEIFQNRSKKTWTEIYQSALENLQKMYPKKSLYEAMLSRVNYFKARLDKGELFNPTSEDIAVFNVFRAETEKRISRVSGLDSNDSIVRQAAIAELGHLRDDLYNIAKVTNPEGEAGRAFGMLQSEINTDDGLKIRRMELMRANGGEMLSPEDSKWVEQKWNEEKELMKKEHEVREQAMKEDFDNRVAQLEMEYEEKMKELSKGNKNKTVKEKTLSQKGKAIADQIRKLKKPKDGTNVDFTLGTWDLAVEGVAKLVEAGSTVAEAIQKMVDKGIIAFKEDRDKEQFENHLFDWLKNKKDKTEALDSIKMFAAKEDVTDITSDMVTKNLIRDYVNSHIGEVDKKDVLETAFKDLKEVLPNITKERFTEAYLKEGEFKQPTKKQLEGGIKSQENDLKRIAKESLTADQQQKIKLERDKKQAESKIKEYKRKLADNEFEEKFPVKLKKQDAELIKIEKEKSVIEEQYRKKQRELKEKNKSGLERTADFARSAWVAWLIGKPLTLAKVAYMSLIRPLSETVSKLVLGKVFDNLFPGISKVALRGGESSSLSSIQEGFQAYFRQRGAKDLADMYDKREKEYVDAKKKYLEYKDSSSPDAKKIEELKTKMNDSLIKVQGSFIYQFIGGASLKDALSSLVNRSNEIEKQFGKVQSESIKDGNWLDKTNYILGFIGRSHSAAKTFSGRFSFAAGFMARLEGAVRNGEDISHSDKILEIAHESYIDWERGKYQQSNQITEAWNRIVNRAGDVNDKDDIVSKALAFTLKAEVAITRVPVNILHESLMEYSLGLFRALGLTDPVSKLFGIKNQVSIPEFLRNAKKELKAEGLDFNSPEFKDALKERVKQIDPNQAALMARAFRKGGLGAGLYTLALISGAVHFGIFPHIGQKKKKDDADLAPDELNPGQVMIGDNKFTHAISTLVEHTPALWPTFMGLGMAQAYHDEIKKGKTTTEAVLESMLTHIGIISSSIPQMKVADVLGFSKQVKQSVKKGLEGVGIIRSTNKDYTKQELKDPAFKMILDKGIELPEVKPNAIKIKDEKSSTIKKLSEYGTDTVSKFTDARKKYFKEELTSFQTGNTAYIDKFGKASINSGNNTATPLSELTKSQWTEILSSLSTRATKKAKAEIFNDNE